MVFTPNFYSLKLLFQFKLYKFEINYNLFHEFDFVLHNNCPVSYFILPISSSVTVSSSISAQTVVSFLHHFFNCFSVFNSLFGFK